MAVEHINETDTLNQGRVKINAILDQSNAASEKVDGYQTELAKGVEDAKQIAADAGAEAVQIATDATASIEATANQANANSQTAINTANNAVSTANQNKQEFDQLRNDFDDLVAEAGDSNPEIVQARTDTTGIKQTTLANRLSVDFGDRMTKADGIEMLSGTTNVKKMMDFTGKTAGNTATNPHQGFSDFTAKALKKPSDSWNEIGQSDYNKLASRDDSGVSTGSTSNGVIPQQLYKLNAVETVKSMAPQLFEGLDDEMAVQFVKDNFVSLVLTIRGKASSPNNKNLKVSMYVASADAWTTQIQGDATEYTDFTVQINDVNYIGDDGFVYAIAYSDFTNGVTAASIDVDYVGISAEVSMSSLDVLEKAGFAKTEDVASQADFDVHTTNKQNPHGVTKSQVGLGDVANYSIATEDEAKEGLANNKYMTPAKVATFLSNMFEQRTYTYTGNGQCDSEVKSNVRAESNIVFYRLGNFIMMNARVSLVNGIITIKAAPKIFDIPVGYRIGKFTGDTWNVPCAVGRYGTGSAPGWYAVAESATALLSFASNSAGNHYISGCWYTDDPMPA